MARQRRDYRAIVRACLEAIPATHYGRARVMSAADLVAAKIPRPRHGDRWGPWIYHARTPGYFQT
jgi:hypothetical protein